MQPRAEWPRAKRAPVPPPGCFGGGTGAQRQGEGPRGRRTRPIVSFLTRSSRERSEPSSLPQVVLGEGPARSARERARAGEGPRGRGLAPDSPLAFVRHPPSFRPYLESP